MTRTQYEWIERYMLRCMEDSAHDREHIYRVLYTALEIAKAEKLVDLDVLICACLLHDIGRKEQFADPSRCHAMVGGEKAASFLLEQGFTPDFAQKVRHCIETHRFRENRQPQSLEAKILFDADKLDAAGATGIARTLMYAGQVSAPLYTRRENGEISDGTDDRTHLFSGNTNSSWKSSMKGSIQTGAGNWPGTDKRRQQPFMKDCYRRPEIPASQESRRWRNCFHKNRRSHYGQIQTGIGISSLR